MPNVAIYPRGFSLVSKTLTEPKSVDGDAEVTRLYHTLHQKKESEIDWVFKRSVFIAATRLIGDNFGAWVKLQESNRYLDSKSIRFIADTIKFITEGRREVTNINWLPILNNDPKPISIHGREYALSSAHIKAANEIGFDFITAWCKQTGGFNDLLITLYAMYGEIDKREALNKNRGEVVFHTAYTATRIDQLLKK